MKVYRIKKYSTSDTWKSYDRVMLNEGAETEFFLDFITQTHKKEKIKVELNNSIIETQGYIDNKHDESFVVIEEAEVQNNYFHHLKNINLEQYVQLLIPQIEFSEYIQSVQKTSIFTNYIERKVKKLSDGETYHYKRMYDSNRVLLLGEPGSGKTTTIKRMAYEAINEFENDHTLKTLPLYFQLRYLNSSDNISYTIREYINNLFSSNVIDEIDYLSEKGLVLYLFDGLDEITENKRREFESWIDIFRIKMPNARVIITSRPILSINEFNSFEKFQLTPFDLNQIKELSYRKLYGKKWKSFVDCLQINDELLNIVKNPLLLNISFILFVANKLIPSNKSTYLKNFINTLICDWDIHRDIYRYDEELSSEKVRFYLTKIAYNSKVNDTYFFDYLIASNWLSLNKTEIESLFIKIKEISGLLVESGDSWQFSHIAFRDFLCANYLIEKADGINHIKEKYENDKSWSGIWNNAYGLSNDPEYYFKDYLGKDKIEIDNATHLCKILQESLKLDTNTLRPIKSLLSLFLDQLSTESILTSISREGSLNSTVVIIMFKNKRTLSQMKNFIVELLETRWSNYCAELKNMIASRIDNIKLLGELYEQEGRLSYNQIGNCIEFYLKKEFPQLH